MKVISNITILMMSDLVASVYQGEASLNFYVLSFPRWD